jgi:hypothetical protein
MVKKKVIGKERRRKNKRFVEKVETYSIFQTPPTFPLTTKFFLSANFRKRRSNDVHLVLTRKLSSRPQNSFPFPLPLILPWNRFFTLSDVSAFESHMTP